MIKQTLFVVFPFGLAALSLTSCNGTDDTIAALDAIVAEAVEDFENSVDNGSEMTVTPGSDSSGCPDVETALQGWLGEDHDHARFHCAQACIPGQNRTAACRILQQYSYPGQPAGHGARLCTYCS